MQPLYGITVQLYRSWKLKLCSAWLFSQPVSHDPPHKSQYRCQVTQQCLHFLMETTSSTGWPPLLGEKELPMRDLSSSCPSPSPVGIPTHLLLWSLWRTVTTLMWTTTETFVWTFLRWLITILQHRLLSQAYHCIACIPIPSLVPRPIFR